MEVEMQMEMVVKHRPRSFPWAPRPGWWEGVRRLPCPSMVVLRLLRLPRLRPTEEPGPPTWTNRRPRSSRPGRCSDRRAVAAVGVELGRRVVELEVEVLVLLPDHSTLPI